MPDPLTSTQLVAATTAELLAGGYQEVPRSGGPGGDASRIFEDPFGIVAVHVFDTWRQLADRWAVAQGQLVDLMSAHLSRPEPKSWEGFLVLLTPGHVGTEDAVVNSIRYDTNRVRKLLAAGEELETLDGLRNALLPLLPLVIDRTTSTDETLLDRLPALLETRGIGVEVTEAVIGAFQRNESVVDALHTLRGAQ
jgi:hypothetical protein